MACESWIDASFKPLAYALILLRHEGARSHTCRLGYPDDCASGYPCVFGGDLWGVHDDKEEVRQSAPTINTVYDGGARRSPSSR
jgi:hypothetical protein